MTNDRTLAQWQELLDAKDERINELTEDLAEAEEEIEFLKMEVYDLHRAAFEEI